MDDTFLSLREILSELETVSEREMSEEVFGIDEMADDEEFLCDLSDELIRLFCLVQRYREKIMAIINKHDAQHAQHQSEESLESCAVIRDQVQHIILRGMAFEKIFWTLAHTCVGVPEGGVGIRKGWMLVSLPKDEEEDKPSAEEFLRMMFDAVERSGGRVEAILAQHGVDTEELFRAFQSEEE